VKTWSSFQLCWIVGIWCNSAVKCSKSFRISKRLGLGGARGGGAVGRVVVSDGVGGSDFCVTEREKEDGEDRYPVSGGSRVRPRWKRDVISSKASAGAVACLEST
jgi:hypothetical protein